MLKSDKAKAKHKIKNIHWKFDKEVNKKRPVNWKVNVIYRKKHTKKHKNIFKKTQNRNIIIK